MRARNAFASVGRESGAFITSQQNQITARMWQKQSHLIQFVARSERCLRCLYAHCAHPCPIHPFQQRRKLRRRQSHHAVVDCKPPKRALFKPLGYQHQPAAVPQQKFDTIRAFGTEHVDHATVGIAAQCLLHQSAKAIHAFAKIDRTRRHQHPNRTGRNDHDAARTACNTICNVAKSAPTGTYTVTVPTTASIAGGAWLLRCEGAATTTGANAIAPLRVLRSSGPAAFRRHANNCCGVSACRRATSQTVAPSAWLSATICP